MTKLYRVTPKNNKWIVQKVDDRTTVKFPGSPFDKKTDAENAMYKLIQSDHKETNTGITFVEAFKKFADWKLSLCKDSNRVDHHSLQRYDTEYRLRISKYMDHSIMLSDFNIISMENYLEKATAAEVPFKTLRKSVKDIKHFIRRANAVGLKPPLDMLTYNILDNLSIVPEDDDLLYRKEVDINLLDEQKITEIVNDLYQGFKTKDIDASYTFAIFCLFFFFGLRASELAGIKRDCVDLENELLHIRGTWRHNKFRNKTKNRGSRRPIPIDEDASKFLELWLYFIDGFKPNSIWLLPSLRGSGALSYKYVHAAIWKLYAKHGLANITVKRDGHVVINSSPLKGFPTKVFRHRFGSHLIAAMNRFKELDRNQVKSLIGHTLFSTSADIYGNKIIKGTTEERTALKKAKALGNKSSLISQAISKNN